MSKRKTEKFLQREFFLGDLTDAARAISLDTLAKYLNNWNEKYFLLKESEKGGFSRTKKREEIIDFRMDKVLEGLSSAAKALAMDVIKGDTSIFGDVMKYQEGLIEQKWGVDM